MNAAAQILDYPPENRGGLRRLGVQRASVLGLGNVLMGDDAFGPLVVETFRGAYDCGPNVDVLDLGTPGLDLTPYLYGADLVILTDCVQADEQPGTLRLFREADLRSGDAQLRLTGHDPGLQESLLHLNMAGHSPSELLIVGVVPDSCEFATPMSAGVRRACVHAADTIARLLDDHGLACSRRPAPLPTNTWWMGDGLSRRGESEGEAR